MFCALAVPLKTTWHILGCNLEILSFVCSQVFPGSLMKTESEMRAEPHSRQSPGSQPTSSFLVWAAVRRSSQRSHCAMCGSGHEGSASPCSEGRGHNPTPKQENNNILENYKVIITLYLRISGYCTSAGIADTHTVASSSVLTEVSWPEVRSDSHRPHRNITSCWTSGPTWLQWPSRGFREQIRQFIQGIAFTCLISGGVT